MLRRLLAETERVNKPGQTQEEARQLKEALHTEKDKAKQLWKKSCQQATEQEALLTNQGVEMERLKAELCELRATSCVRGGREEQGRATPTGEPAGSTEEQYARETRRQATFSEVVQLGDPFINGEQR